MNNASEYNTIFFKLRLKRTRTPEEVFEKMRKYIKNKPAARKWTAQISDSSLFQLNFNDDKSETLSILFDEKKTYEGFCKVCFPLSGEFFENEKQSEFKTLINMIHSARTSFADMRITDDYGISESFLDSKTNKIILRELDEEELKRAERIFKNGQTNLREFITAVIYDYRGLSYSEDFISFINRNVGQCPIAFWESCDGQLRDFFSSFVDSFLYETVEYKNMGRLCSLADYYSDLNGIFFAVWSLISGMEVVLGYANADNGHDPKSTQVMRLYKNKYFPLTNAAESDFERCILVYRFLVSCMDYLGFKYVGTNKDNREDFISGRLASAVKNLIDKPNSETYRNLSDAVASEYKLFKD